MRLKSTPSALAVLLLSAIAASAATFDVRAFGARGDGRTLDTAAVNAAIAAAAASGGGTVVFGPGTYLCASIRLRSHLRLELEPGSVILAAAPSVAPYDPAEPNPLAERFHYQDFGHSHWQNSLIWGIGLDDVSITGTGMIHGAGLDSGLDRFADGQGGDKRYRDNPPLSGNKAIALRDCRNVLLRDFTILHGGWFGILATGVDNLDVDHLTIDTNRDGMDIDACRNVRITRCSVNSPWDDGICLKASYALGALRNCENVTISDCFLAGSFDEGSLADGTFRVSGPGYRSYHTGRIKLGTESNGDFRNIAIANCLFDGSRGVAIESVDGSHIEDVTISNLVMRHVYAAPIFIRLGARLRGPPGTRVGAIRRVSISHIVASDADWTLGCVVSGIPGHCVEDLRIDDVRIQFQGTAPAGLANRVPPEEERSYPEPSMFGKMPSYAFFLRHVRGVEMHDVRVDFVGEEPRPPFVLRDVDDAAFRAVYAARSSGVPVFRLVGVRRFHAEDINGAPEAVDWPAVDRGSY